MPLEASFGVTKRGARRPAAIRNAPAAAAHRSGKTAGLRRPSPQAHNRTSWPWSFESLSSGSKPLAGIGVADRGYEEAKAEGQHDQVQHGNLLTRTRNAARRGPKQATRDRFPGSVLKCHSDHRFSRRPGLRRYKNLIKAGGGSESHSFPIRKHSAASRYPIRRSLCCATPTRGSRGKFAP
jgi:hypothetical protein